MIIMSFMCVEEALGRNLIMTSLVTTTRSMVNFCPLSLRNEYQMLQEQLERERFSHQEISKIINFSSMCTLNQHWRVSRRNYTLNISLLIFNVSS